MTGPDRTPRARYRRGLMTSVVNNGSAFGFSVMITASYGMLEHFHSNPSAWEVVLFAVGAVLAISVIEASASRGFRRRPDVHPNNVVLLGTAANFVSVLLSLGIVYGAGMLIPAPAVWPVAPLLASGVYVLTEAAELAFAERIEANVFGPGEAGEQEAGNRSR